MDSLLLPTSSRKVLSFLGFEDEIFKNCTGNLPFKKMFFHQRMFSFLGGQSMLERIINQTTNIRLTRKRRKEKNSEKSVKTHFFLTRHELTPFKENRCVQRSFHFDIFFFFFNLFRPIKLMTCMSHQRATFFSYTNGIAEILKTIFR